MASANNMAASGWVVPSSAQWFCRAMDAHVRERVFAFASRSCVILFRVEEEQHEAPRFDGTLTGHTQRVTCVAFATHSSQSSLIASGAADGFVRVWDWTTKTCLNQYQHSSESISSIVFSPNLSLLLSGDRSGRIVVWNTNTGQMASSFSTGNNAIQAMTCSPAPPHLVAVGLSMGSIVIMDLSLDGTLSVLHRLRGHTEDVQSLAFQPVVSDQDRQDETESNKSQIASNWLASGARDRTVRIWDAANGKLIRSYPLPQDGGYASDQQKLRVWVAVTWNKTLPSNVICSSQQGSILQWNTLETSKKTNFKRFGQGHTRTVFDLVPFASSRLISSSMDRQMIMWDIKTMKPIWSLPSLGGFVYALDIPFNDPSTLAVGVGDSSIRLFNVCNANDRYDSTLLWRNLQAKVTMVRWHRSKESVIAFGTDEGHVGVYDIERDKSVIMTSSHHRTVYSLAWLPSRPSILTAIHSKTNGSIDVAVSTSFLVSCGGDNQLVLHHVDDIDLPSFNLGDYLRNLTKTTSPLKRSEISCSHDGDWVAVGNADGTIELWSTWTDSLHLVLLFQGQRGVINRIAFRQDSNACACASDDGSISILDLSLARDSVNQALQEMGTVTTSQCMTWLRGHTRSVNALSWSQHDPSLIVSASSDGTAQVWRIIQTEAQAVANYRGHDGRVFSAIFSAFEPDLIYTGGEDQTIRSWRPSEQSDHKPPVLPKPENKKISKKARKARVSQRKKASSSSTTTPATEQNNVNDDGSADSESDDDKASLAEPLSSTTEPVAIVELEPSSLSQSSSSLPLSSSLPQSSSPSLPEEPSTETITSHDDDISHIDTPSTVKFDRKPRTLLPLVASLSETRAISQLSCLSVAAHEFGSSETKERLERFTKLLSQPLGKSDHKSASSALDELTADKMFGSMDDLDQLLSAQETSSRSTPAASSLTFSAAEYHGASLALWRGDIAGALQLCRGHGDKYHLPLLAHLAALAPSAGVDAWMHVMRIYGEALIEHDDVHGGVNAFLALNDIDAALQAYLDAKLYRDAAVLCRVRLSSSDPRFRAVWKTWARHLDTKAQYEIAARCYMIAGDADAALSSLGRKGDLYSHRITWLIASLIDHPSQYDRCLTYALALLAKSLFNEAFETFKLLPIGYRGFTYLVATEKLLESEGIDVDGVLQQIVADPSVSTSFVTRLLAEWHSLLLLPLTATEVSEIVKQLQASRARIAMARHDKQERCLAALSITSMVLSAYVPT